MLHWRTTFDPNDGTPIGSPCDCNIGEDHDGAGNLILADYLEPEPPAPYQPGTDCHCAGE